MQPKNFFLIKFPVKKKSLQKKNMKVDEEIAQVEQLLKQSQILMKQIQNKCEAIIDYYEKQILSHKTMEACDYISQIEQVFNTKLSQSGQTEISFQRIYEALHKQPENSRYKRNWDHEATREYIKTLMESCLYFKKCDGDNERYSLSSLYTTYYHSLVAGNF